MSAPLALAVLLHVRSGLSEFSYAFLLVLCRPNLGKKKMNLILNLGKIKLFAKHGV